MLFRSRSSCRLRPPRLPHVAGSADAFGRRRRAALGAINAMRSEEHTSELQSHSDLPSFPTRCSSDLDHRVDCGHLDYLTSPEVLTLSVAAVERLSARSTP